MRQINLKFFEQCPIHSKYYIDIIIFLNFEWGKRDKLVLIYAFESMGESFLFPRLQFFKSILVKGILSVPTSYFVCGQGFVSCSVQFLKPKALSVLRGLPSLLPSPPAVAAFVCGHTPLVVLSLFLALKVFPFFLTSSVLYLKGSVLHSHFMFLQESVCVF